MGLGDSKKKRLYISLCLVPLICSGCSGRTPEPLILEYDDFGPQVIAHELIGMGWYQWNACGSEDDNYQYHIRVVIYKDMTEEDIRAKYPSVKGTIDYRYIQAEAAEGFLAEKIAECRKYMQKAEKEGPDAKEGSYELFERLVSELTTTLDRIKKHFK